MISWKYSFKRLNEEYEIAKKKKQALDNLFVTGRISQATRDSFNSDISAAIIEIEKQQKDLVEKMQSKTQELENNIKTLETLLANYEIQHVVGEIDEEIYQREINLLATGLETARNELGVIKQATIQLCPPAQSIQAPAAPEPVVPVVEAEVAQPAPVEPTPVEIPVEVAPIETVALETAPVEPALVETAPITPPEPEVQVINEPTPEIVPQEPAITEPAPQEPIINMEAATVPEVVPEPEQPAVELVEATTEALEVVPEQEAIEQVIEPVIEQVTVEDLAHESHPLQAPHQAPTDVIVEQIAEAENNDQAAQAEENEENTTE